MSLSFRDSVSRPSGFRGRAAVAVAPLEERDHRRRACWEWQIGVSRLHFWQRGADGKAVLPLARRGTPASGSDERTDLCERDLTPPSGD